MAYIDVVEYDESEGKLRDIYDDLIVSRGKLADVHMIQSLNPESIVNHMDLYMTIMFGKSPLRRVQREMIAVVVSKSNDCDYCQMHHASAVNHYWKDEIKTEQLKADYSQLELSEVDMELCHFAKKLTQNPNHKNQESIEKLKKLGLPDRAILDATLVISYFNFVNRIVLGLGLNVNENELEGYNYD
ncbi:MAG: peroxidase-related enzyme [Crocinitomicaceae bacterium]|nr:peroxidase-related enzyme [Flavobacteriales bacterium]NQZ38027.1 peroxidase-related enzyme [Crocinitomicaceae bacterium]